MSQLAEEQILVLYDGVCGLCNFFVRFLIRRDRHDRMRFATLQSELGRRIVERHGGDPDELSSVYVVERLETPKERARVRGKAALFALRSLGGAWKMMVVFEILPAFLLNLGYRLVAAIRYRLFGRLDACPVPTPEERSKFLAS
jgi:predicted DCC family thiol-disulfide oxidoreductase YuxK